MAIETAIIPPLVHENRIRSMSYGLSCPSFRAGLCCLGQNAASGSTKCGAFIEQDLYPAFPTQAI